MILRYLLIIILLTGLGLRSSAQLSFGGSPASFSIYKKAIEAIPVIEMEPVDNDKLIKEEQIDSRHLKVFRFAKSFPVDISPDQSGIWVTDGETKIWRLGLRSKGAWSINLIFDKMIIPQGASLFIYTLDHSKVLGAFTSNSEQSSGHFATYPIAADELIVEYNEPKSSIVSGELHIATLNHDYKNIFGTRPLGESGLCNMDVYCPEAANYRSEKQSVVCMLINGSTLCTGTLVNNTKQDKTPYILSAGHCIENATDAQQTVFCFNYESPACGYGKSSINGFADQTLSGAILKARSDSLDFSLMQLEVTPPAEFRPYFAGWDHSSAIPTSSASISHPRGDVKKISKDNDPPKIGSFDKSFTSNSFWIIGKWEIGSTEGGSSGCGLFNQNRLVVGTLTGGTSTCADPTNDLFSMLNKQWDSGNTSDSQLKYWLDPNNTGASDLPGLSPFDATSSCTLFSNSLTGEKDTLMRVTSPAGGYKTGHNNMKITGYAERFTKTDQTLLTSVALGAAKISSTVSNPNSKIVLKIYDEETATALPGNELVSMDVPLSILSGKKMNFIELPSPVVILKHYFVGFEINYSNPKDTFAVYSTPDRNLTIKNSAFAKSGNTWKPFYSYPGLGISTSLLISANGCENTMSKDTVTTNPYAPKYTAIYQQSGLVLYQQIGLSDNLVLQNNGTEVAGTITLYDILGRKLFEVQRVITTSPGSVSTGQLPSGIYFLTIETGKSRQVMKFQVNYPR
ncbi:MAG: T9SS type A sorting domain-containing protein [Mariniphaga sp.]